MIYVLKKMVSNPETGKHFFFNHEMHHVLHYDGGETVKIAPYLHRDTPLYIPKNMCHRLLSEF
jgi:hypothetical protein